MKVRGDREALTMGSREGWWVKLAISALGIVGIGISGYLTYIHYLNLSSICLFSAHCDAVLTSQYAQMWGIPLSLFGMVMYAVLTVMGLSSLWANKERQGLIALGTYGVALSGILFTGYLYYLEIFVIHAFCTWCIFSSIEIFTILLLSIINLSNIGLRFREIPHEPG
jgi:uncharacterized membrane protein